MTGVASTEQIVAHMKLHGVEQGSTVIEKCSKAKFQVAGIDASGIKLTNDSDGKAFTSSPSMFLSLYDRVRTKQEDSHSF